VVASGGLEHWWPTVVRIGGGSEEWWLAMVQYGGGSEEWWLAMVQNDGRQFKLVAVGGGRGGSYGSGNQVGKMEILLSFLGK